MANHVKIAMSLTPVAEGTIAEGGSATHRAVGADIGKTLGSSYTVDVAHTTVGYTTGSADYDEAEVSGGTTSVLGNSGYDAIFIKHSGFKYDGGALGTVSEGLLKVTFGSQEVCQVPVGGSVVLPNVPAVSVEVISTSATDNIAVEYILVT